MKYGIIGAVMPLILDRVTYKYLIGIGVNVTKDFKRQVKAEYKAMVKRTPSLAKDNSLAKNLKTRVMRWTGFLPLKEGKMVPAMNSHILSVDFASLVEEKAASIL